MQITVNEAELNEAVAYFLAKKAGLQRKFIPGDVSFRSDSTGNSHLQGIYAVVEVENREEPETPGSLDDIFRGM
jgi:hypothetical protein